MNNLVEGRVRFIGKVTYLEGEHTNVDIFPEFVDGLYKIVDYSHLIILYWFHQRDNDKDRSVLHVIPKRHPGAPEVGVFASRSPSRPNPIGLCVVEVIRIEGYTLTLKGLDAIEGSPIIDIKPYLPRVDLILNAKTPEWYNVCPSS